ncbi:hypothetical protein [Nitratireductor soli]|uniref:hypothetical protein n=1 Tax=Nitratireductor soli TaxID=1670619 RepID=UPI000A516FC5|nr:hypothetical protein [Nitratireductor soli]
MPEETDHPLPKNGGKRQPSGVRPILAVKGFILSRWRGEAPLATVFWRDSSVIDPTTSIAASPGE